MSSSEGEHPDDTQPFPSVQPREFALGVQDESRVESDDAVLFEGTAAKTSKDTKGIEGTARASMDILSDEEPRSRPNRFQGPDSTWREWTLPEREIATSLDQLRAQDLSIHLYNTHALRLRARQMRHELQEPDRSRRNSSVWEPSARWAAWPVPMGEVPRDGQEGWIRPIQDDPTIRSVRQGQSSKRVLEEAIIVLASRKAREQFKSRKWEEFEASPLKSVPLEMNVESSSVAAAGSGNTSHSMSCLSSSSGTPLHRPSRRPKTSSVGNAPRDSSQNRDVPLEPVPLADDDQVTLLLRPSVRHVFSHLDALLTGLHVSREKYTNINRHEFDDMPASEVEDVDAPKSRKLTSRSRSAQDASPEIEFSRGSSRRPLKRRHSSVSSQSGTNYSDGDVSSRKIRKRSRQVNMPPRASPSRRGRRSTSRGSSSRGRTRSRSISRIPKSRRQQQQLKLRDWSDVLGMAAITGWDADVLMRAQRRCESLFQERMDFVDLRAPHMLGSDEDEIEDGVHIDGFLKPIKAKRGWRGKDLAPRAKKGTKASGSTSKKRGRPKKEETG